MRKTEENLHLKVCEYLRRKYPWAIFRTDFSSGMKMTVGQAAKHKKFQSSRAWPDLFIAHPRSIHQDGIFQNYAGLFIELKSANAQIYKKDGSLRKNQHIEEQAEMLAQLRHRGYRAEFAVGWNEAIELIHSYLGEPPKERIEF